MSVKTRTTRKESQTFTMHIPKELNKRFAKICIDKEKDKRDVVLNWIQEFVEKNE